jgi:hypothetical protein
MQIPALKLKPPPRYGDLKELEITFSAHTRDLMQHLAPLFGKRTPRSNRKDTKALKGKLHKFLLSIRPYLLGLEALKQGSDREKCAYALLEGLMKEQFRALGKRWQIIRMRSNYSLGKQREPHARQKRPRIDSLHTPRRKEQCSNWSFHFTSDLIH